MVFGGLNFGHFGANLVQNAQKMLIKFFERVIALNAAQTGVFWILAALYVGSLENEFAVLVQAIDGQSNYDRHGIQETSVRPDWLYDPSEGKKLDPNEDK